MVISSRIVKIRKPHRCWGCNTKFQNGDKMEKVNCVDEGEVESTYWCEICSNYWKKYMAEESEGISQGDLAGEEHYQNYKQNYDK